jgi:hypothetical protein
MCVALAFDRLGFSDAETFCCHVWRSENTHDVTEHEHDSPKVSVWCALMKTKLSVLSVLKNLVTGDTFLGTMGDTALCHVPVGTVFQLDGVPPHFSHCIYAFLEREFPDHWVTRWGPILWPPHSPDLTPWILSS